jgi:hypothetical protein
MAIESSDTPFDCPVILFDDVILIFPLADFAARASDLAPRPRSTRIAGSFVDR